MSPVLKRGIIAAGLQLFIVTLVTCLVSISSLRELLIPAMERSTPHAELLYVYPPLKWLFLLIAIAIALTDTRSVALAAMRIRHKSRLMKPTDPDYAAEKLLALVGFSALGFTIFTLDQPPEFIVAFGAYFKSQITLSIMWSGLMSIGVANFGRIAYAAWRAVHDTESNISSRDK